MIRKSMGFALVALTLCVACTKPPSPVHRQETTTTVSPWPPKPDPSPLPPGEEYVRPTPQRTEAEALAEPLTLPPENTEGWTAEELRHHEMLVRLGRGETVDLDGDGYKESSARWVNGVYTYTEDFNRDGIPDEVFDGRTLTVDRDGDGVPNKIEVRTIRPNGGRKVVREEDEDGDGFRESRWTVEVLTEHIQREVTERREPPAGPWVVESDVKAATRKYALDSDTDAMPPTDRCRAGFTSRFPSQWGTWRGTDGVHILTGADRRGYCNQAQGAKALKALTCVRRKLTACLGVLNSEVADVVKKFVRGGPEQRNAVVSCSGDSSCGTAIGVSDAGSYPFAAIELTKNVLIYDDDNVCEVLLHEILHAVNMRVARDHDTKGNDRLYSCARVCSGCAHVSIGAGDDHRDCARCAGLPAAKELCGLKPLVGDDRIPDEPPSCVRSTPQGPMSVAGDRRPLWSMNCDDTRARLPPSWCIEKCPEGYTVGAEWCQQFRPPQEEGSSCKPDMPLWLCDV